MAKMKAELIPEPTKRAMFGDGYYVFWMVKIVPANPAGRIATIHPPSDLEGPMDLEEAQERINDLINMEKIEKIILLDVRALREIK